MDFEIKNLIIPSIFAISFFLIFLIIRAVLFSFLLKWTKKTETKLDDIIIDSFKRPSILWCIALGIYIGISTSEIPSKYSFYLNKIIQIIIIISVTVAVSNLLLRISKNYIEESKLNIPTSGLFYIILKFSIYIIGFLIILNSLNISITPMITALGVGGLAVALALQDTLSNLFAGVHILVEKMIRVGDYIKIENGQEGYVEDINWRTTRIKTMGNNIVVIPNTKLSQSIIINYDLPEKTMLLSIPINVDYSSDPEKVEKILLEEAEKGTVELEGLNKEKKPIVRLNPGFGESSLSFTLMVYISEYDKQFIIQSELRKRILKRFNEEGIKIPFPQRTIHLKNQ